MSLQLDDEMRVRLGELEQAQITNAPIEVDAIRTVREFFDNAADCEELQCYKGRMDRAFCARMLAQYAQYCDCVSLREHVATVLSVILDLLRAEEKIMGSRPNVTLPYENTVNSIIYGCMQRIALLESTHMERYKLVAPIMMPTMLKIFDADDAACGRPRNASCKALQCFARVVNGTTTQLLPNKQLLEARKQIDSAVAREYLTAPQVAKISSWFTYGLATSVTVGVHNLILSEWFSAVKTLGPDDMKTHGSVDFIANTTVALRSSVDTAVAFMAAYPSQKEELFYAVADAVKKAHVALQKEVYIPKRVAQAGLSNTERLVERIDMFLGGRVLLTTIEEMHKADPMIWCTTTVSETLGMLYGDLEKMHEESSQTVRKTKLVSFMKATQKLVEKIEKPTPELLERSHDAAIGIKRRRAEAFGEE